MIHDYPLILQKASLSSTESLSSLPSQPSTSLYKVDSLRHCWASSVREELAGGEPALPMAGIEALLVGQTFGNSPLQAADVTKDQFREELKKCSIMHL